MTDKDDDAMDAALARVLSPKAGDTAPLSRAVLNRMITDQGAPRGRLAEVVANPLPAGGLALGALLLAGAAGYALVPPDLQDLMALHLLIGQGF